MAFINTTNRAAPGSTANTTITPKQSHLTVQVDLPSPDVVTDKLSSVVSLRPLMESAFAALYSSNDAEGHEFRKLLNGYNAVTSQTGSVQGDQAFAAAMLRDYCVSIGGSHAAVAQADMLTLLKTFKNIRKKAGVDTATRMKLAKQIAAQVRQ